MNSNPSMIAVGIDIIMNMSTYSGKSYIRNLCEDCNDLDEMIYTYNNDNRDGYAKSVKDDIATAMKTLFDLNERLKKQTSEN